jgi:thiol-disulfide isomerase/thioredoxin
LTRRGEWLALAAVAVLAAAAGFAYNAWRTGAHAPGAAAPDALAALMATRLPDLEQRLQSVGQWHGKVVVVNFWATWCAPCREEIPLFVKLQKQYGERGVQFVGVAIDDAAKVKPYAAELRMNFPVLVGGADLIDLTRKLGNRAGVLPFTVVVSRSGRLVSTEVGTAHNAKLEPLVLSLLGSD